MHVLWGLGGMAGLLAIAWLLSENRRAIRWRTVLAALALQLGFGVVVLYWSWGQKALEAVSNGFQTIIDSSQEGKTFLFGPLSDGDGDLGYIFAFQVLPVIIFFAALTAVLYHFGILQWVVQKLGGALGKALGTRRAESVNAAANIFVGQTEAPLVIRPYLAGLTRSGLFAVMVGGLTTVAGSVLVGYALLGARLEHLIAASFMAAPGALLMAKMILPEDPDSREDEDDLNAADADVDEGTGAKSRAADSDDDLLGDEEGDGAEGKQHRNVIDAAASGANEGLKLALTIGAMLLAFISLIALINTILRVVGGWFGAESLSFEMILGYVFAPVMMLIGVPWAEATDAGSFVGQKVVINEFVAFSNFAPAIEQYSPRTAAIITFALTGFANLGSLGILLGGLGSLVKKRRPEIAELGLKAILAATLANLMSAAIAGMLFVG